MVKQEPYHVLKNLKSLLEQARMRRLKQNGSFSGPIQVRGAALWQSWNEQHQMSEKWSWLICWYDLTKLVHYDLLLTHLILLPLLYILLLLYSLDLFKPASLTVTVKPHSRSHVLVTPISVFYLMADLVHHHHGELHLIGEGGDVRIQQDLLLHKHTQAPVLHGCIRMLRHRQEICTQWQDSS